MTRGQISRNDISNMLKEEYGPIDKLHVIRLGNGLFLSFARKQERFIVSLDNDGESSVELNASRFRQISARIRKAMHEVKASVRREH